MATFQDRRDAGRVLASRLETQARGADVCVLGLPRGGIPVAHEVARVLRVPLDILVVRKLGVPGHEEVAMGAIANGVQLLNEETLRQFHVSAEALASTIEREQYELKRREQLYRGLTGRLSLTGKRVILIDDGVAQGLSMRAAIEVARMQGPSRIIVAAPVGPPSAFAELSKLVDEVFFAVKPKSFLAVGSWYENFEQTEDEEVQQLLAQNARELSPGPSWASVTHAAPL